MSKTVLPVLPPEIWNIILQFKENMEYNDDCVLGSPIILRSGRLLWNNTTRIQRFMNDVSFLIKCHNNNKVITVEYFYDIIINYYYFVKTLKNESTKQRIKTLIRSIERKIEELKNCLELNLHYINLTPDERKYCLNIVSKCSYFIRHFNCISTLEDTCNRHMLSDYNGDVYQCKDFHAWCR